MSGSITWGFALAFIEMQGLPVGPKCRLQGSFWGEKSNGSGGEANRSVDLVRFLQSEDDGYGV
jgi:hypothetical protein